MEPLRGADGARRSTRARAASRPPREAGRVSDANRRRLLRLGVAISVPLTLQEPPTVFRLEVAKPPRAADEDHAAIEEVVEHAPHGITEGHLLGRLHSRGYDASL